jgi:hypothetical protein
MWSNKQKEMITPDGNIYRYIGSSVIDKFDIGDSADISFPNGYGKGPRVFKGYVPCLTVCTIKNIIIKTKIK